jgi:hypothetical protein
MADGTITTPTLDEECSRFTSIGDSPEWLVALVARGGGGFVEVRYGRKGFPRQEFLSAERVADDPEAFVSWTLRLTERYDVAIGMTVRGMRNGKADGVVRGNVLWADIDGDRSKLDSFPLRPHLIVESGTPGHLHAYWALPESLDLTDPDERRSFASGLDGVQRHTGSDNVRDLARIMRMPGTLNWKRCASDDDDPAMAVPIEFRPEGILL